MNIKEFAIAVLNMNSDLKKQQSIDNLKNGLEKEPRWDTNHKNEVKNLINFLESGSENIEDLPSYVPSF